MPLRIMEVAVGGGAGLVRGFTRKSDITNHRSNPDGSAMPGKWPYHMLLDGVLFAGGIVADMMRMSPSISETLIIAGSVLLGDDAGFRLSGELPAGPAFAFAPAYAPAAARYAAPAVVTNQSQPNVFG